MARRNPHSQDKRKREVANNLLTAGEGWITELDNEELRKLLMLDRSEAMA